MLAASVEHVCGGAPIQGVVTPIRAILTDATGVTVWSRGHRRLLGVVTGSPKDFWCRHKVTENFQHCRIGSRSSAVQSKVKELRTYIQWCRKCLVHQLSMLCQSLYYTRH